MSRFAGSEKLKHNYETILAIVLFLLIIFLLVRRNNPINANYILYAAMIIGIAALLSKKFAGLCSYVWEKLMAVLGYVNSRILLSAIFFLVLFPISIISRIFRKDFLQLKRKQGSYYTERGHTYVSKDLENPW